MRRIDLSEDDQGKEVVDANGAKVGVVATVREGVAYVEPDPSMFDTVKSKLGWGDTDEDTYPLDNGDITAVNDDEVRITY